MAPECPRPAPPTRAPGSCGAASARGRGGSLLRGKLGSTSSAVQECEEPRRTPVVGRGGPKRGGLGSELCCLGLSALKENAVKGACRHKWLESPGSREASGREAQRRAVRQDCVPSARAVPPVGQSWLRSQPEGLLSSPRLRASPPAPRKSMTFPTFQLPLGRLRSQARCYR